LGQIENATCLTFVERTTETAYITIKNDEVGCWAIVGYQGEKQEINLENGCVYVSTPFFCAVVSICAGHAHILSCDASNQSENDHGACACLTFTLINCARILVFFHTQFDKLDGCADILS